MCSGGDLLTPFVVIVSICVFMTFFKINVPYRTEELGWSVELSGRNVLLLRSSGESAAFQEPSWKAGQGMGQTHPEPGIRQWWLNMEQTARLQGILHCVFCCISVTRIIKNRPGIKSLPGGTEQVDGGLKKPLKHFCSCFSSEMSLKKYLWSTWMIECF